MNKLKAAELFWNKENDGRGRQHRGAESDICLSSDKVTAKLVLGLLPQDLNLTIVSDPSSAAQEYLPLTIIQSEKVKYLVSTVYNSSIVPYPMYLKSQPSHIIELSFCPRQYNHRGRQ